MKLRTFLFAPLFAVSVSTAYGQLAPFVSSCAEDAKIAAPKRQSIDGAAGKFIQTLFGSSPAAAFDAMSTEGRRVTSRDEVAALANAVIQLFFTDPQHARVGDPAIARIQNTYLLTPRGKSPGRLICSSNLSKPEYTASMVAADLPEQAYVIASTRGINNDITLTLWLVPEQNQWRVQGVWSNASTMVDKDSVQLRELARNEASRGHAFNAALLLTAAGQLAARGPDFESGILQAISTDLSELVVPADVKGQPPFLWKDANRTWKVINVGPIAIGGKIYVMIVHEVERWQTDSQVDGWNRELLADFKKRFPEYSAVFAGLVARARESGTNRGYGTVEESGSTK